SHAVRRASSVARKTTLTSKSVHLTRRTTCDTGPHVHQRQTQRTLPRRKVATRAARAAWHQHTGGAGPAAWVGQDDGQQLRDAGRDRPRRPGGGTRGVLRDRHHHRAPQPRPVGPRLPDGPSRDGDGSERTDGRQPGRAGSTTQTPPAGGGGASGPRLRGGTGGATAGRRPGMTYQEV